MTGISLLTARDTNAYTKGTLFKLSLHLAALLMDCHTTLWYKQIMDIASCTYDIVFTFVHMVSLSFPRLCNYYSST